MLCREPSMSRRRPHTGEKGRYGLPRSSVAVSGLNVRDIQDALIRAACACGHDPGLLEEAKQGESATLHRNSLFLLYDLDMAAVHDALGAELEKLMGIYPNVLGADLPEQPKRRFTDRENSTNPNERPHPSPHPSLPPVRNLLPMPNVVPPKPDGYVPDSLLQTDEQYNGWTAREKLVGRARALGINPPPENPNWWQRLLGWFG